MREIDTAVERFKRRQRPLESLGFEYIAKALAYQASLPQRSGGGQSAGTSSASRKREPLPKFSPPECRTFTPEEIAALESQFAEEGKLAS